MRSAYLTGEVSGATIRALNYTPETYTLRRKIADGNKGNEVGELFSIGASYHSIFKQLDCQPPHGEEILTQVDMFATEPSGRTVRRNLITDLEARRVHRGMILIAGAGQMEETNLFGRAIIADNRLVGKLVSSHVVTLSANDVRLRVFIASNGFPTESGAMNPYGTAVQESYAIATLSAW